jgi:hypothetical protein
MMDAPEWRRDKVLLDNALRERHLRLLYSAKRIA